MRKENWDWFNIQKEDTDGDIKLKSLVVHLGGTFFIGIICLIIFLILKLTCGGH